MEQPLKLHQRSFIGDQIGDKKEEMVEILQAKKRPNSGGEREERNSRDYMLIINPTILLSNLFTSQNLTNQINGHTETPCMHDTLVKGIGRRRRINKATLEMMQTRYLLFWLLKYTQILLLSYSRPSCSITLSGSPWLHLKRYGIILQQGY